MRAAQFIYALFGNPFGIVGLGLGLWGFDTLTGFPVFLSLLVAAIAAIAVAALIKWRTER